MSTANELLEEAKRELLNRCEHDNLMPDWTAELLGKIDIFLSHPQPTGPTPEEVRGANNAAFEQWMDARYPKWRTWKASIYSDAGFQSQLRECWHAALDLTKIGKGGS